MNARIPFEAVLTGVVSTLRNSTSITGLVGSSTAIYNDVEPGARRPYLVVTIPVVLPKHTAARFGAESLATVKAVSEFTGDREAARIIDRCVEALHFAKPTIAAPHVVLGTRWESVEPYHEVLNGITIRHHPANFRVWTEQTS